MKLHVPKPFNLRTDPFERADTEMWDQVATHEFPMSEAAEAFKILADGQKAGKIRLYPHRH